MRTMSYVPKICQEGGSMEGSLTLKVPHAKDKIGFLKKLKFKFGEGGKVEVNEDYADVLAGMIDIAEDIIIEANLKHKDTGREYVKEDLFYEPEFQETLGEVGKVVMEGMGPSKNL